MAANSFGTRFVITSFGESHGTALGVVVDGCPAGVVFDNELLQENLRRRRPGTQELSGDRVVSAREEADEPEILSGVFEGKTLGTPIAIIIRNRDARPQDYAQIKNAPRPGHADDVWIQKFGHVDHRGGGRASGRETVARVLGGSVAQMYLKVVVPEMVVRARAIQIGPLAINGEWTTPEVAELLRRAQSEGRSYGGLAEVRVLSPLPGLGQPVFRKLKSDLAAALMSVGAVTGVELGAGFAAAREEGSEFHARPSQEQYGGIRGGISTGDEIVLRVAFKPTATVLHQARSGRHDPCVMPRALPVIESMVSLVLADHYLCSLGDKV